MVGSVLYAAMATRPDIAQAVAVVSKFNSKPYEAHLTAVKRILRYLKGTVNLALKYLSRLISVKLMYTLNTGAIFSPGHPYIGTTT